MIRYTPQSYEDAVTWMEKAKQDRRIISLGNGEYGRVIELVPFQYSDSIESIVFEPVRNAKYWEKRFEYHDDYTIHVNAWIELFKM